MFASRVASAAQLWLLTREFPSSLCSSIFKLQGRLSGSPSFGDLEAICCAELHRHPPFPSLCVTFCLFHIIAQGPNDFPPETEELLEEGRFCCEPGKTQSGWEVEACVLICQGSPVPLTLLRGVCGREGLTQQPHPLCSCRNPADLLPRTLEELKMEQQLLP